MSGGQRNFLVAYNVTSRDGRPGRGRSFAFTTGPVTRAVIQDWEAVLLQDIPDAAVVGIETFQELEA